MQSFWKDYLNAKNVFLQLSQLPHHKACHDPWCLLFRFCRVSLAEYFLVLRALFPLVADVLRLLYQLPLSCDGRSLGPWAMVIHYISSDVFVGDNPELALYFELCECVI
jgi:hypothetical protein